uniref:ATPase phospholipid transporting 10B n=1 Tax=Sinocyclocheilus rhinocerous TaxID=307959 RepID=A0A673L391_9TELE
MTWTNPLTLLRHGWTRHQGADRPVRTMVSNLPFEDLKKREQPSRRGNAIKTNKYRLWSFIPMSLFEQFHRMANIYFVGLAFLHFVPVVNALQPEVALIPICVILALTAVKDGWEDFRRQKQSDNIVSKTYFWSSRSKQMCFVERRWKDVRVGDFVRVLSNQIILDGETNLRQRKVVPGFSALVRTKSMLNNSGPRYKRSKIERKMNMDVLFCVVLLFFMCLIGALGHAIWLETFTSMPSYIVLDSNGNYTPSALAGFYMFFTMIILLQMGQIFFITQDVELYHEELDSWVQCRALNITEDLGQIQYVFPDKTGTLTENKMVFRHCSIMGTEYCHEEKAALSGANEEEEVTVYQQTKLPPLFPLEELQDIHTGDKNHANTQVTAASRRRSKVAAGAQSGMAFSSPLVRT